MLATRHLHLMLKAGIPITEAVSVLEAQSKGLARNLWKDVLFELENGASLHASLSLHTLTFDSFYLSLIRVGEESGELVESLEFLAEQLSKDLATKRKLTSALAYPALVFVATLIMGGFISLFILPQLVDFFDSFDLELPLATRMLLLLAEFSRDYGVLTVLLLLVLLVILAFVVALPGIKPAWHRILLRLPLVGGLLRLGQLSRFCRNLGVLLKSGLPVTQSLEITALTLSNLAYSQAVDEAADGIREGSSIAVVLEDRFASLFPPLLTKMIGVGERTGKLDETLLYLATYIDEEIDVSAKNFVTILEPMMLLVIGILVAGVALAIIGPIYQLTGNLGGGT